MAMTQSLLTGVTGLRGSQFSLDVVGNNLANIGTAGFKASRVGFADLLSQSLHSALGSDAAANRGGINPASVGTGLGVASADATFTQGTLLVTGRPTDLALQGDGFFVLQDGTERVYSRAGSFRFDSMGRLVSPDGKLVQGWQARVDTNTPLAPPVLDTSNPADIGNIQINQGMTLQARETSILNFMGNLDAGTTWTNLGIAQNTFVSDLPVTHQIRSSIVDSLGNEHPLVCDLKNVSGIIDNECVTADPFLGANGMPDPNPPGAYPNNVWRFEFSIDPSDQSVVLAPDGSYVGEPAPDYSGPTPQPGDFKMFARSGFLVFDTNGSLQEVRYGQYFDYPVGTWPEQTVDYQMFPQPFVSYQMGPAPLLLVYQNIAEPNAPGGATGPVGVTAGERLQDKYPVEEAAGGNNHLLMSVDGITSFPITIGPPSLLGGPPASQYLVLDDPNNPGVWSTIPPASYPLPLTPPGTAPADFYVQEVQPFFGTGGTPTAANRTTSATAAGNSLTWLYQVVTGGTRDGMTQDTTGEFRDVAGVQTYQPRNTAFLRSQDGYRQGILSSLSVDALGRIQGSFDNGITVALGQVAVASFENPRGLTRVGAVEFNESANSGSVRIGVAGTGGLGTMVSGVLEQSNVDASQELTEMIVAQRSFEANSRIISTADRILETLANLGT